MRALLLISSCVLAAVVAGEAGAMPAGTVRTESAGPMTVDYRSFRQRYYDPYATPYFYAPPAYTYRAPPPPVGGPPFVYGWVPPPRPASCGRYFYWDGVRCVDARRHPPYVGPRAY